MTLPLDNGACLTPTSALAATTTDESGNTTTYTLDRFGNPLTVTDALGNVTTYTCNADEQVTEVQQPAVEQRRRDDGADHDYNYTYSPSTGVLTNESRPTARSELDPAWDYTTCATAGGNDVVPIRIHRRPRR